MLSVATLFGCDSILDKEPLDTLTNGNFWTNEDNVKGYAFAFYNEFLGYGNGNTLGDFYFKVLTDNQVGNGFTNFTPTQVPASDTKWRDLWTLVRRANILLENVRKVSMSETAKDHWEGVGKLMRAWGYYKLVRTYGNVPWVDGVLDITNGEILYGSRNNRDEIMDKVLEDLNDATTKLNDVKSNEINRSAGNAMKSEICLFEGTFRKYRPIPDVAGAEKYLRETKTASEFILGKTYSLSPTYRQVYNSIDLANNPEMILYKEYRPGVLGHSTVGYITSSTMIHGLSKNAVEAYLFADGKPLSLTSENTGDEARIVVRDRLVGGNQIKDTVMSIKHVLSVRDKRLSQTIDTVLCYVRRDFLGTTSSSGYRIIKYDNDALTATEKLLPSNPTDAPIFWLAVIYLNYAEACAELGTITQADLDRSINLLKKRAGLPNLTVNVEFQDPANNMNISNLIWEIRRERRCELMTDNDVRFWDLIRWHQLDKLDSNVYPDILLGANIKADEKNTGVERRGDYVDGSKGLSRTFQDKYYLTPIPSGQITLNPQLAPNNPGW
ncbi:RagB/SusD family nutrient uptake outer membrane protein [termite gut metagenome]|uniref:RagB/SusD family nutrient uptake outer membrane protein n=1 Tax=termite gut metagenome TaxID=433724 RepID=A0A5J4QSV4_9ZZZZ